MKFRGHTLVWHDSMPAWFAGYINDQNAQQIMLDHITKVVGHYAGRVHSWDVVNEIIWPPDKRGDGLREMPWAHHLGSGFIETAFRTAAQADPHAILTWNENASEEEWTFGDNKRSFWLRHLKELVSRGVPIHAIGIQSHLTGGHNNIAGAHFQDFLKQVSDLGLKIMVTELDVKDYGFSGDVAARDQAVADVYYKYLTTMLANRSVIAVLTWGISDKYTFIAKSNPRNDGAPVRPLPFDENMQPTATFNAIAQAFDNAPSR